jgi:hypothetical protein
MESKKIIDWLQLSQLRAHTQISDDEHSTLDPALIHSKKQAARPKWKSCKKRSAALRQSFLKERADFLASRMNTTG